MHRCETAVRGWHASELARKLYRKSLLFSTIFSSSKVLRKEFFREIPSGISVEDTIGSIQAFRFVSYTTPSTEHSAHQRHGLTNNLRDTICTLSLCAEGGGNGHTCAACGDLSDIFGGLFLLNPIRSPDP